MHGAWTSAAPCQGCLACPVVALFHYLVHVVYWLYLLPLVLSSCFGFFPGGVRVGCVIAVVLWAPWGFPCVVAHSVACPSLAGLSYVRSGFGLSVFCGRLADQSIRCGGYFGCHVLLVCSLSADLFLSRV